jgi:hypothetical protein
MVPVKGCFLSTLGAVCGLDDLTVSNCIVQSTVGFVFLRVPCPVVSDILIILPVAPVSIICPVIFNIPLPVLFNIQPVALFAFVQTAIGHAGMPIELSELPRHPHI